MSNFKDFLAKRKQLAAVAANATPPTPPPPEPPAAPQPAKAKNKAQAPKAEKTAYACGHAPIMAHNCPGCVKAYRRKKNEAKQARKEIRRESGRLPDESAFYVKYAATTQTWTGTLTLADGTVLTGSHSSVFRLLQALDAAYRAHANRPCEELAAVS